MSDPTLWSNADWEEFYEEHTSSTEGAGEAAQILMDIMVEADDGNFNNAVTSNIAPEEE